MSRRLLAPLFTLVLAAAALAAAPAVALAGDPCFHAFDNRPAPSNGSTSQLVIGDCVFSPTVNRVPVGTIVTWKNASIQAHEVVGSNMTWGAHGKLLEPGDTIGWTFETAGVYAYSCMIHPGMTGAIIVGDAVGTALGAGTESPTSGQSDTESAGSANVGLIVGAGSLAALAGLALLVLRRRATEPMSESEAAR